MHSKGNVFESVCKPLSAFADGEKRAAEAHAQAFKRAGAQFGFGRYFYELPKLWVPHNKAKSTLIVIARA